MSALAVAGLLLVLLGMQISLGQLGFFGLDFSLCGVLVLCTRMRSPYYQLVAITVGLLRDAFSLVPLGAQALAMGITAGVLHFFGSLVFLESFWIQGMLFFTGYILYQLVFFLLGEIFGFLDGGFWALFPSMIPKAFLAVLFCWFLSFSLARWLPKQIEI